MPRGRHRFSSPMRRLLPPVTLAAGAIGCAAASWLVADDNVQMMRWLAAGGAAAAVAAAVLTRYWDRVAALQVTEATGARARAERKHQEQLGELKGDLEEARRIRGELERRLGSRHVDLARLRTDHAALLARYATAEAERADALEGRRQLAIESSTPAKALPPGGRAGQKPRKPPSPATYLRASVALDHLSDNAARQGLGQSHEQALPGDGGFSYFVRPRRQHPQDSGQRGGDDRAEEPGDGGTDLADVVGPEVLAEAEAEGKTEEPSAERKGDTEESEDKDEGDEGDEGESDDDPDDGSAGPVINLGKLGKAAS